MAVQKNFVIKNGLEVNNNLIFANKDSDRVGIATTNPLYTLDVDGTIGADNILVSGGGTFGYARINSGIITVSSLNSGSVTAQNLRTTGLSTFSNIVLGGYVSVGGTTGKDNQILVSTGTGVSWAKLSKSSFVTTAIPGQDTFYFSYEPGSIEVYINGVRLIPNEFTANDGNTIVLNDPCFGGESVEILGTQTLPVATGNENIVSIGITVQDEGTTVGTASSIKLLNFTGAGVTVTSVGEFGVDVNITGVSTPPGKTIYVTTNGDDNNDGLTLDYAKSTIKSAVGIASRGDTVKVSAGIYVENNPITIPEDVSIEGAELRNCIVTPQNRGSDLFWVTNGNHITDLSFQGQSSLNNASVVAFKPLLGVASDRYFDAARMIRYNLDFIASEAVGFLTSVYYPNGPFSLTIGDYTSCKDDIKDIFRAVCHDITRGGNSKCVGAGLSYYTGSTLQHIVGVKTETIDTIQYAAGIARAVINNSTWGSNPVGVETSVVTALYDNTTGVTTITAINHGLSKNDAVKVVGLGFTCPSGPGIVTYPSGSLGYIFNVKSVNSADEFEVIVGQSTLPHTYDSGGTVQKYENFQNEFTQLKDLSIQSDPNTGFNDAITGCENVVSAIYSCVGVVTTIIDQGPSVVGSSFNIMYPGNAGIGTTNPNNIPSQGVGLVTKGPYIRNCTNFIPNSIGMNVNGFYADPGDKDDMGITGMMSVDSYTQYNQGGIGVKISNGAYAQLVSIFTICNNHAIITESGGQCDITNSNSSFGTYGLVSNGVSDPTSKSNYRYTGHVSSASTEGDITITVSGLGKERPYSGQAIYFDELYYDIESVTIYDGGSGYVDAPTVIFTSVTDPVNGNPSGPSAIKAEAIADIANGKVTGVTMIGNGRNYRNLVDVPSVTFTAPPGIGNTAVALVNLRPLYYQVRSATVPSAGVSTITLANPLNNDVGIGITAFFFRQSLQIVSSHSFEYIGAGNTIELARPSKGGVTIQENEVVKIDGGEIVYTSTDQDGNFAIGDDLVIDQATGTIRGRAFERSLLNTVTPFIIALGAK